jgi:hypothetical protein
MNEILQKLSRADVNVKLVHSAVLKVMKDFHGKKELEKVLSSC